MATFNCRVCDRSLREGDRAEEMILGLGVGTCAECLEEHEPRVGPCKPNCLACMDKMGQCPEVGPAFGQCVLVAGHDGAHHNGGIAWEVTA